ncbi:MAG: outer membrane protein assembly factor BamA [Helicobacteraceae bacterium]|jgi:outer membrane protein insertion porin family|nr:outer membrane protein assembly factor BamA [Helicobacteraceae bacterium]
MRALAAICCLTFSASAAVYNEIRFESLVRLSPQSATEIAEIQTGRDVSAEQIDAAIKKFFALEYFTDIAADEPEKGVLRFTFKEKPAISKIDFKGVSDTEKDDRLMPVFGIKQGEIYDLRRIDAAKKRLIALAQAEGYYDTFVEVDAKIEGSKAELEVTYAKGSKIEIQRSDFHGANSYGKSEIERRLANRESQFMSWFPGRSDGVLRLNELGYDAGRLKDFYLSKGHLDVVVSEPFLTADMDSYYAALEYDIEEGEPYFVDKISITIADRDDISLDEMIEDLRLQSMRRFDITKMRADIDAIFETAAQDGYAFARVTPDLRKDKDNLKVSIDYQVTYGKKVKIRDVIISGNSRTIDRVIRRELYLAPGDLYNLKDIRDAKNALGRLGYFESVRIEERRVNEEEMDLVVVVKETNTGSIMLGGGYSSYEGVIVNAAISDRNLFGSGYSYEFAVDTSKLTRRFELSLTNPRVMDSPYSLSFSLYKTHYEATTYIRDTKGGSVTLGRRLGRNWRAGLTSAYSLNYNEYLNPSQFYVNGETAKLSLTPFVNYDSTDDYYLPREGATFSQSLEFAGFGADEEYTRSSTSLGVYKGFEEYLEYDLILRYRARFQIVQANIDDVKTYPIGSRLFLGGTRSVRGYQSGTIAPYQYNSDGTIAKDGDTPLYIGGKRAFNNSAELSIPLIPESNMRLTTFFDYGAIGVDDLSMARKSWGWALEWISPMGPLQFIFAYPIAKKEEDITSRFEFTLGQRF